jgi:hypothetical protein
MFYVLMTRSNHNPDKIHVIGRYDAGKGKVFSGVSIAPLEQATTTASQYIVWRKNELVTVGSGDRIVGSLLKSLRTRTAKYIPTCA